MSAPSTPNYATWPRILGAAAGTLAVGLLSGLATANSVDTWFSTLERPWFAPPNWLFGPVWTALYILMGIAAGRVWNHGLTERPVQNALVLYVIQLVLNAAWSLIFFVMRDLGAAAIELSILWFAIFATLVLFARVDRTSAWLLAPYIVWVSFAWFLNLAYVQLN